MMLMSRHIVRSNRDGCRTVKMLNTYLLFSPRRLHATTGTNHGAVFTRLGALDVCVAV